MTSTSVLTFPLAWAQQYRAGLASVVDADSGVDPEADWPFLAATFWNALPADARAARLAAPTLGYEDGEDDGEQLLEAQAPEQS